MHKLVALIVFFDFFVAAAYFYFLIGPARSFARNFTLAESLIREPSGMLFTILLMDFALVWFFRSVGIYRNASIKMIEKFGGSILTTGISIFGLFVTFGIVVILAIEISRSK
jgi:hypothetical protein